MALLAADEAVVPSAAERHALLLLPLLVRQERLAALVEPHVRAVAAAPPSAAGELSRRLVAQHSATELLGLLGPAGSAERNGLAKLVEGAAVAEGPAGATTLECVRCGCGAAWRDGERVCWCDTCCLAGCDLRPRPVVLAAAAVEAAAEEAAAKEVEPPPLVPHQLRRAVSKAAFAAAAAGDLALPPEERAAWAAAAAAFEEGSKSDDGRGPWVAWSAPSSPAAAATAAAAMPESADATAAMASAFAPASAFADAAATPPAATHAAIAAAPPAPALGAGWASPVLLRLSGVLRACAWPERSAFSFEDASDEDSGANFGIDGVGIGVSVSVSGGGGGSALGETAVDEVQLAQALAAALPAPAPAERDVIAAGRAALALCSASPLPNPNPAAVFSAPFVPALDALPSSALVTLLRASDFCMLPLPHQRVIAACVAQRFASAPRTAFALEVEAASTVAADLALDWWQTNFGGPERPATPPERRPRQPGPFFRGDPRLVDLHVWATECVPYCPDAPLPAVGFGLDEEDPATADEEFYARGRSPPRQGAGAPPRHAALLAVAFGKLDWARAALPALFGAGQQLVFYTDPELDEAACAAADAKAAAITKIHDASAERRKEAERRAKLAPDWPLQVAAQFGHAALVARMLREEADATVCPGLASTAFFADAGWGHAYGTCFRTRSGVSGPYHPRFRGYVSASRPDNLKETRCGHGFTMSPLSRAAAAGHLHVVALLLARMEEASAAAFPGGSARGSAADTDNVVDAIGAATVFTEQVEVARMLLRRAPEGSRSFYYENADEDVGRKELNRSLVAGAVRSRHLGALRLLIGEGVDFECFGHRNRTPLCEAVKSGWRDGIDALMDAGADPFLVSDDDDHPFRNRSAADMSVYDAPPAARARLLEQI
jgi:hypothetical protein